MGSQKHLQRIEDNKSLILDAERYIWKNPETGFKEWKTHSYLKDAFEKLGLTTHSFDRIPASVAIQSAENGQDRFFEKIPGFYVDFDTGRPGPRIAVFGEMDALIIPNHPECDSQTGAVHSCGHHAQCAALLGVAIGLTAPNALDGLSGSIRLIAVPAEEGIEMDFRNSLQKDGVIRYHHGKKELIWRGLMDDVDLAFMIHTVSGDKLTCCAGSNGCIVKKFTFLGRSAHAAEPEEGINALYAANLAISAANALRETFVEKDTIRFHPIITCGGTSVNAIPDCVTVESYVRGAELNTYLEINKKINRAFAAAAASIGCRLRINDLCGSSPRHNNKMLTSVFADAALPILGNDRIDMNRPWGTACSDFGDISHIMPASHLFIGGAAGTAHGSDYYIANPELSCVTSAKIQVSAVVSLLENGAEKAKRIVTENPPLFASVREFLSVLDKVDSNHEAVFYHKNGDVTLSFELND